MGKVSVAWIAEAIAGKHGLSQKDAEQFVATFFDLINEALHEEKMVKVKGLGTFKVIDVRERESINVNTGERVVIESHGKISFTPDPIMRDLVNKPFAQFETVMLNDDVDIEELNAVSVDEEPLAIVDEQPQEVEEEPNVAAAGPEVVHEQPLMNEDQSQEETVPQPQEVEEPLLEVVGQTVEEEPEQVVEEEPEQVVEEELPVEAEEQPQQAMETEAALMPVEASPVDDEPQPEEESSPVEEEPLAAQDEDDEEEEKPSSFFERHETLLLTLSHLFVAAIALAIGYIIGMQHFDMDRPVVQETVVDSTARVSKTVVKPAAKDSVKDSVKEKAQQVKEDKHLLKEEDVVNVPAAATHDQSATANDSKQLATANAMVKTGAYRIVGTAKTITVKKGDTMERLSRLYLGEGMSCYIQLHNGVAEVSEGMKLKIPKLEPKKRTKRQAQ
ncbi:MAG: HU family DNA-binding protein [Prevotella sp.]|nr:HU family DNA-binding protein [Prevotella sp.]